MPEQHEIIAGFQLQFIKTTEYATRKCQMLSESHRSREF